MGNDLATVAKAHGAQLFGRALSLSREPSDAWDLLQDAFERALVHRPPGLSPEATRRWLLVVMRNLHLDQRRSARRRRVSALTEDSALVEFGTPEVETWRSVEAEHVRACIERLDPRVRAAYLLHVEGLPLTAIAEQLGVPVATVGTRLFRARRRLRELLSVDGEARD